MVFMPSTLPDLNTLDADTLRALLLATHEQLLSRDHEIEHLKLLIAKLRRMQFGRKSEKVERQIEQLELQARRPRSQPRRECPADRETACNIEHDSTGIQAIATCASRSSSTRD